MRYPLNFQELERRVKEEDYLVITGCARSGTQWIAKVLTQAGVDVGHWRMLGEHGISSDLLAPLACLVGGRVLHQVRYPINQIGSMQTTHGYTWRFISQVVRFEKTDSLLQMCMKYWLVWNACAEKVGRYTYRIEDIDNEWHKVKEIAGLSESTEMPDIPRNVNTRAGRYTPITWEILEAEDAELYNRVLTQAWEYGYRQEDMSERIERLNGESH
jgi:hypothetical protein